MNRLVMRTSLPTIEELKCDLNTIVQLAAQGANSKEIDNYFENRIRLKMFGLQIHEPSMFNKLKFYRARLNIGMNENINSTKTFSYPPKEFARASRCNLSGNPVFYTSIGKNTAILEVRPTKGDIIYLSEWSMKLTDQIIVCNFINEDLLPEQLWIKSALNHKRKVFNEIRKKRAADFQHLKFIYNFWCERFINEESPYKLTSYISHKLLFEMNGISAISYPSRQQNLNGLNTAFHPNVIDNSFSFSKVYKYKLTNTDYNTGIFTMKILEKGEVHDDNIIWSEEINKFDEDYWNDLNPKVFKKE